MFARHRKLVNLSLISLDLPLQSSIRTTAVLYRKDRERCHILFSEPLLAETPSSDAPNGQPNSPDETPQRPQENQNLFGLAPSSQSGSVETLRDRHLWLEISPYRAILTMQGNGGFSYRHLWEQGVYGTSRYWLQTSKNRPHEQLRLRNFTRSYAMEGKGIPQSFRLEYELWTQKLSLGRYVLSLEVQ